MILKKNLINCRICKELLNYPVECIFYDNKFCKECWENSIKKKAECPTCNRFFSYIPNDFI